ncbi:hypothetical protein RQP53_16185 [Paucibacter sp. APW11]|uniref:ABC transporter permease n=1 Tax=Roseateles aquae TaxID=3077235 RepID=A0ABU3PF63_9BURK|nr:hypothetical protein [Paucibacter sp. APW11]MDT9000817.1 hypothetical protein [Paucibacter sp. APW11]
MNLHAFAALVLNEVRLRSRRTSTLVVMLAMVALAWLMIADPHSGRAMMVVSQQRMIYDSNAISFGTALLSGMMFGIAGFYLSRGRSELDLRHGCGQVLGATPVNSAMLLLSRWLGALLFLCAMAGVVMLGCMVMQAVRGEAPVQPLIYLRSYALTLLPTLMLAASLATLCDAWVPLMGKRGDLLFFVLWIAQFSALPATMIDADKNLSALQLHSWLALDVSGIAAQALRFSQLTLQPNLAVGGSSFDASLPLLTFPDGFWNGEMLLLRLASALLALLPLLPALGLFHRFAPDRVRVRQSAQRPLWARALRRLTQPLARLVARALGLAARWPGAGGQIVADMLLALICLPVAIAVLPLLWLLGLTLPSEHLPALLAAAVACWGVLVSELPARDQQSGTAALRAALPGGAVGRYQRQWLATLLLGLLFTVPSGWRWLAQAPLHAAALCAGLVLVSGIGSLLAQSTGGGRSALALFAFGFYLTTQVRDVAWFDAFGYNAAATPSSCAALLLGGLGAAALGRWLLQQEHRS